MANVVKTNFFKLDSNVDGSYVDKTGNIQTIENMIQAVGAADGPGAYPDSADVNAPLDTDELNSIPDLTSVTNVSGHGILYNEKGEPYAHAGDLVLRDGKGNVGNLDRIFLKASTINEDNKTVFLRDASLQQYNSSDKGLNLNDVVEAAIKRFASFGVGNIRQTVRNFGTNVASVAVQTVKMTEGNYVWITASAMVNDTTVVRLRDTTSNTTLDTTTITPLANNITPVFCSYFGPLVLTPENVNVRFECNDPLWNSYLKRFFKLKDINTTFVGINTVALEVISGPPFIRGSINLMLADKEDQKIVITGEELLNSRNDANITFDEPMASNDYAISVQTEVPIQHWYSAPDKSETGFTIKFERAYTGRLLWSAIL